MKKALFGGVLVLGVLGAGHYLVRMDSYQGFAAPVMVEIPKGTSTLRIGEMLEQKGVVRNALLFAAARVVDPKAKPQAGEYEFRTAATVAEVFGRIARGDVYRVELRVPEGSTVFEIAELAEKAGFGTAAEFLKAALPLEGYLFPSTYRFARTATAETVMRTMRAQFDKEWAHLGGGAAGQKKVVILASLVETEARLDEERARIAGVYANRLAKGMRLECDPTVEYAARLDGRWRGKIYKSDLASENKYNTYRHAGLPPGPVANPGARSLQAALKPAETDELFFVAKVDGTGGHTFSRDYEGHQKAVVVYRHGEKASRATGKSAGVAGGGKAGGPR
ncbi:MAG: endolytic transglycosylase MltG [Bryobacterales bacterium]|nr:endolytic transglycosylase MltG [Bryobacterales bacterium]